jgi:predicted dehydrogenase
LEDNPQETGPVTVDDAAAALVRFDSGALGTIEATRVAAGRKNQNRFEINGSRGSLAFNLERMNELEVFLLSDPKQTQGFRTVLATDPDHHPYIASWWPPGHILGYEHTFTHTIYDLLEGIRHDVSPQPDFADAVRTHRVMAAWERSADARSWEGVGTP